MTLPQRNANTMSEAIALSSPSGGMSARARRAAEKRLAVALFGSDGLPHPACPQPTEAEAKLRRAKYLRELASRGMSPRKYIREAKKLEREVHAN